MGKRFDKGFRKFGISLITAFARLRFNAKKDKSIIENPSKGALLVCNHTSVFDFAYLISALYPRSDMRFLVTAVQYDRSKFVRWVFKHLGMIRKNQGARDLQSVKEMLKASRAGEMVVLYPAGMTSFDGRAAWEPLSGIGSMPKLLKCDVYAAVAHGGFISRPRYAHKVFRGRVDTEIKRVFTAEEVAKLDAGELQEGIKNALSFNDWDWQEQNHVKFRRMKNMKNLSRVIYMCPACRSEGYMTELRGALRCEKCGLIARRDKYGFFEIDKPNCPTRMDRWVDMEIESIKNEMQSERFCLKERVKLLVRGQNEVKGYKPVSDGELRLTKEGISFESPERTLNLSLNEFQFLIFNDINAMMINTEQESYRFEFEDVRLINKWFFSHRLMMGIDA